ncbi:sensor histidine kinase [Clostridium cibarium]|uniref:histidine kinase n=1 Tax=Clostridium cibarium TaxID=2762247 RepID=A0ABR8PU11_9CLOT|nr:HAMP domain-containing sensor histidine kinase [Clostridium cibarium]MBD7911660.1 HAMP domain-containing histidine kinase [Clostridium cibarium]
MGRKKNEQLMVALFKYYITFVIILACIFVGSYFVLGVKLSNYIEEGKNVPIYSLMNDDYYDYKNIDTSALKSIGGYLEVLDSNKNVIYTDGKANNVKKSYTDKEFEDTISMGNKESEFNVICKTINKSEEEHYIALIMIPRDKLTLTLHLNSMPYRVGKPLYKVYFKVIGAATTLFLISILIYSIWTAKKIKRPLMKIDEALGKVIEGEYEEKLVIKGQKEFIVISDTINFLIDKLKNSKEENARLEQSKTRMLIDLSHDIKTPITTIRGFSAALYEGLIEDEEKKERYYKTIYNKAEHVGELVDDLFEYVKMDSTQYVLKLESVDICEFTRQVLVNFYDELEEKNFDLIVRIPDEAINFSIDARLFRRVISNLIENAIKYNPEGTKLRIEIKNFKRYLLLEVADSGVGISDTIRDKVFDVFVRGDESRSSDGGSGLGLAIAKKIVENHGGEIDLYTDRKDESTVFSIKMFRNT